MIRNYVRDHSIRKLQIGSGLNRLQGWLNTDIVEVEGLAYLDATKRFPLEESSFHYIFAEHVIEHLNHEDGMKMLWESHRILVPGGKIRIATPNLLQFIALFKEDKSDEVRQYLQGKLAWHDWPKDPTAECFILNLQMTSFGHKFLYDPGSLKAALTKAGFRSIREFKVGESDDPHLQGVEQRQNSAVSWLNDYETMIFQAESMRDRVKSLHK